MLLNVLSAVRKWWTDRIKDNIKIAILPSIFGTTIPGSSLYSYVLDILDDYPPVEPRDPVMYTLKDLRKILIDFRVPIFAIELLRVQKRYTYKVGDKQIRVSKPERQLRIEKYPCSIWIDSNYGKVLGQWASKGSSRYEI